MNQTGGPFVALPGSVYRIGWALAFGAIATSLYLVDPASASWLPKCPVHWLTGWHCPGCGSTRAAHALLHLDVTRALSNNPLLVGTAPLAAALWAWKRWRLGPNWSTAISARCLLLVLVVLVAFAVARNVPSYPFSLLAPP